MVAAELAADSPATHPLPLLGLAATLCKAFLTASQAWCVYTELGCLPLALAVGAVLSLQGQSG